MASVVIFVTVFLFGSVYLKLTRERRRRNALQMIAEDREEFLGAVVSLKAPDDGGYEVEYLLPEPSETKTETVAKPPFLVEYQGQNHVVCVYAPRDPKGTWLLLDADLAVFELTDDERTAAFIRSVPVSIDV